MAHTCPDCGQLCHCIGDIDDIWSDDNLFCTHYDQCQADDGAGEDDEEQE